MPDSGKEQHMARARWKKLIVAVIAAVIGLGAASPTLADKGGVANEDSFGWGKELVFSDLLFGSDTRPGAGESRDILPGAPSDPGTCTGPGGHDD
jgi:hypothetical protein